MGAHTDILYFLSMDTYKKQPHGGLGDTSYHPGPIPPYKTPEFLPFLLHPLSNIVLSFLSQRGFQPLPSTPEPIAALVHLTTCCLEALEPYLSSLEPKKLPRAF